MNNKKLQLPKSVLDMKFMRKTKERIEKELDNKKDHSDLYSDIISSEMRKATNNYISQSSFIYCEELLEGRLSFKGMNSEIERLMELEANQSTSINSEMQKDVSDEILAKKFAALKHKRPSNSPIKHSVNKKGKYVKAQNN